MWCEGLDPGVYSIEWWNTFEARTIRSDRMSLNEGSLQVFVPSFSRDIACKITPML